MDPQASQFLNLDALRLSAARQSQMDISKTPRGFSDNLRNYHLPPPAPLDYRKSKRNLNSEPLDIRDIKDITKLNVRSTKAVISRQVIMYPYNSIETPKTERSNKTFLSFNSILTTKLNTSGNSKDESLFAPFSSREDLDKQLAFNKKQERMFRETAKKDSKESYDGMQSLIDGLKKKKMPKITVYPSYRSFNVPLDSSKQAEQNSNDDEDKKSESEPASVKNWIKLDFNTCRWYWHTAPVNSLWNPNVREGAAFVAVGKYGYMYGGVSKELHNQMEIFDIEKWQWVLPKQTGDMPEQGRQGHSMDYYEKTLIMFGGAMCFNTNLRIRECLNEVRSFSTDKKEWKYIKCTGEFVSPRRNHASVIVGKHLLIYGGIDANGEYLDDMKVLDLARFDWKNEVAENHPLEGIAFHRACVVISPHKVKISLNKIAEPKMEKHGGPKIQEEGIYFFGGKTHEDEINSTLRVLKIGQRNLSWVIPKTQGAPPGPRYMHTMVHCPTLNILVVYGGRNDYVFAKGKSPLIEEIFALELEKMTWLNIPMLGMRPSPRCSHVAGIFGTKMLVFGGINLTQYCTFEGYMLEMDPVAAKKMIIEKEFERAKSNGIFPLVSKKTKMIDESFSKTGESESPKKEYEGIVTFLPVMSRKQIHQRRMEEQELNGDIKTLLSGLHLTPSEASRKSILTNRTRPSVFRALK